MNDCLFLAGDDCPATRELKDMDRQIDLRLKAEAENKRLREALEEIAKNHYGLEIGDSDETAMKYWASRALIMRNQARAALDGE